VSDAPRAPTVVPPERRPRRDRIGTGVGLAVLLGITLAAMAHVAVQARRIDVALALGEEQKLHAQLLEQHRRLESDIGRLKDPAVISTLARERLNMGPVDPTGIRVVRPGKGRRR
jgi:cell division protein FtsL